MTWPGTSRPPLPGYMLRALAPLGFVTVLSIGMAIWSHVIYNQTAAARVAEAEATYQAAKDARSRILQGRRIQEGARTAQHELDALWSVLPTQQDFTTLALDVSELGRAEGVLIPGMNYALKPPKEQTVATEATLSFQATGPYAGIYRFIHRLEHHSTFLVIDKLDVRRLARSDTSRSNLVSISVTLTTFLKPAPAAGGA